MGTEMSRTAIQRLVRLSDWKAKMSTSVSKQGNQQAFWSAGDAANRAEVHFQHHGVDHQPQQNSNGHVHLGTLTEFQFAEPGGEVGEEFAEGDPDDQAQQHPDGQITLEEIEAFLRRNGNIQDSSRGIAHGSEFIGALPAML